MFEKTEKADLAKLSWYKKQVNNGSDWSLMVLVSCINLTWMPPIFDSDWATATMNVSTSTGALTIFDFQQSDEGWYRCQMTGNDKTLDIKLELFGSYFGMFYQHSDSDRLDY